MVSDRVKRNIFATLLAIGILCIVARIWGVATSPKSGHAWFELFGTVVITYLCSIIFVSIDEKQRNNLQNQTRGIKFAL